LPRASQGEAPLQLLELELADRRCSSNVERVERCGIHASGPTTKDEDIGLAAIRGWKKPDRGGFGRARLPRHARGFPRKGDDVYLGDDVRYGAREGQADLTGVRVELCDSYRRNRQLLTSGSRWASRRHDPDRRVLYHRNIRSRSADADNNAGAIGCQARS